MPRLAPWLAAGLLLLPAGLAGQAPAPLTTHAEQIGWRGLTPHDSVVAFYTRLAATSPHARLREIGRSREGRALLQLTLSRPAVNEPWEAHASGRPIVFISAQVHGDEPAGKEGLMLFARDLAMGPLADLLDRVVFVLVPQVNPDGAEAGNWGTRANRAGYNINRDYLRLVNPETRAVVSALAAWRPHIVIDAHELTGPRSYDFYTLHPTTMNAPDAVVGLAAGSLTAAVRTAIEAAGYTWFPYHLQPSDPTRVAADGLRPAEYGGRTLRGYGGELGAVTLLFESKRDRESPDARVGIERRARMQRIAMEAVGRFAADSAAGLLGAVREARTVMRERGATWDAADSVAVTADVIVSRVVDYRMPEMRRRASGEGFEPTGRTLPLRVPLRDSAVATLSRVRPVAYLIEAHRGDLAEQLAMHGLAVEHLAGTVELDVESYRVDRITTADEWYEGYLPRSVRTTAVRRAVTFTGAWLVRTDQPNAAILFSLAEPESEDSFATTGWLATEEATGQFLPVHRVRTLPDSLPIQRD